ncbi:MAG: hypothetical protein R3E39_06605 [Anaerolineae bacterium]
MLLLLEACSDRYLGQQFQPVSEFGNLFISVVFKLLAQQAAALFDSQPFGPGSGDFG